MKYKTSLWLNLPSLSLSTRVLFSGFLLTLGCGLIMAGAQIFETHGMADGEFGVSIDDIVYSYYGNRKGSTIEAKLNGSMSDKAPAEVKMNIIKWVRDGAPKEQWDKEIHQYINSNCAVCHSGQIAGFADLTDYDKVRELAKIDEGQSFGTLTRVSHIHLFGISFIFFIVGFIFNLSVGLPKWLKELVMIMPFVFLVIDILAWWLTKMNPNFAWFVLFGGFGYSIASTFMIFTSLYQMWILPRNGKQYKVNELLDDSQ